MKHFAPATQRNREPILAVLQRVLPTTGIVLEVASGSGEHVVFFAEKFPQLVWQPTDFDANGLASIGAWVSESGLANIRPAMQLDASAAAWPIAHADAVMCINMIHISPFEATVGLMRGAAHLLAPGQRLVTYGPYKVDDQHTAPSNAQFDASLRSRDPRWGIRDIAEVASVAADHGLRLTERVPMPANNFTLVFERG